MDLLRFFPIFKWLFPLSFPQLDLSLLLGAFFGRALLAGILGGIAGVGIALLAKPSAESAEGTAPLLPPSEWLVAILVATLLACLAAWLPSLAASRRDPAEVLRHD